MKLGLQYWVSLRVSGSGDKGYRYVYRGLKVSFSPEFPCSETRSLEARWKIFIKVNNPKRWWFNIVRSRQFMLNMFLPLRVFWYDIVVVVHTNTVKTTFYFNFDLYQAIKQKRHINININIHININIQLKTLQFMFVFKARLIMSSALYWYNCRPALYKISTNIFLFINFYLNLNMNLLTVIIIPGLQKPHWVPLKAANVD